MINLGYKLEIKKDGQDYLVMKQLPTKKIDKFPIARLKSFEEAEKLVKRMKERQKDLGF